MSRVAIIGEGVIGMSTALAIQQRIPGCKLTVFSKGSFEESCSYGPAGLFRIDNVNAEQNRRLGVATFAWYESLCRRVPGSESGVKLLTGHILSDVRSNLAQQEKAYGDIVYGFRWLTDKEIHDRFAEPASFCIEFSAFAAEGNRYVPFLRSQLNDVVYERREISHMDELGASFDVVVNCGGLEGGRLAGDDDGVQPTRGIVLEVEAPWHKHFFYRDFDTFTIPKQDVVALGSVKQRGNYSKTATKDEVKEIMDRYCRIHPAMKGAKIRSVWCELRPSRDKGVRIESVRRQSSGGRQYTAVHHYGHGGGGFTLGWGSALEAADLVEQALAARAKM